MEKLFIAYYRVSTKQQGNSGLGLEAQRASVMSYIKNNGNRLIAEYTECESGRHDNRPMLQKALVNAKETGATLVIAKLDRLSRNVHFISTLMESKVNFICCDMPDASTMTVHIFSAIAQWERERISQRTREALAQKKLREPDWRPGTDNFTDAGRVKAMDTIRSNSVNNESARKAYHFICLLKDQGLSYKQIANRLNQENYRTRLGKVFTVMSVFDTFTKFKNLSEPKQG